MQVNESMVIHSVSGSVCYPRDNSVTQFYNVSVVTQVRAVVPFNSDPLHNSSSCSSPPGTLSHTHRCSHKRQKDNYCILMHFNINLILPCSTEDGLVISQYALPARVREIIVMHSRLIIFSHSLSFCFQHKSTFSINMNKNVLVKQS